MIHVSTATTDLLINISKLKHTM